MTPTRSAVPAPATNPFAAPDPSARRPGWVVWGPPLLLILAWAVLFLPPAELRGLHYEEGRRALAAIDMLEHGRWLVPQVLGVDYVNKPPLLPWAIAGIGWLLGGVGEWAVRLPPLLMTLTGALVCYALAGRAGGTVAGLVAGGAFLSTPMILEKAALGETDVTVTVLTFAAFALWWTAAADGPVGWLRWVGCAALLAAATLTKGPIPLGFFAVAIASWGLWQRRWHDLVGLAAALAVALLAVGAWALAAYEPGRAGQWQGEMRLAAAAPGLAEYLIGRLEVAGELLALWLPWLPLALPVMSSGLRRRLVIADGRLPVLLALYAGGFTVFLMLWPHALPRYAMPAVPAMAVAAGLAAAALWHNTRLRRIIVSALAVLALAQIGLGTGIVPLRAELYRYAYPAGVALGDAVRANPAPVVLASAIGDLNVMYYSGLEILNLPPGEAGGVETPAWLITTPQYLDAVRLARPDLPDHPALQVIGRRGQPYLLFPLVD